MMCRDQGYAIMGTGQVVHNLRDLCKLSYTLIWRRVADDRPVVSGQPMPYTQPFLQASQEAIHSSAPLDSTISLFKHPLYKKAHPTPEHLLPLAVAVAAAEGSRPEDIYVGIDNMAGPRGGLGWGMWRWK